jgi:tetratricopeptide (TPR) repeat protein
MEYNSRVKLLGTSILFVLLAVPVAWAGQDSGKSRTADVAAHPELKGGLVELRAILLTYRSQADSMEDDNGTEPEPYVEIGADYINKGDYQRAEQILRQALIVKPGSPKALRYLCLIVSENEFLSFYRELVLADPSEGAFVVRQVLDNSREQVLDIWKEAAARYPNESGVRLRLGDSYLTTRRYAEALSTYQDALGMNLNRSDAMEAHGKIGLCYVALGNKDAAWSELGIVLDLEHQLETWSFYSNTLLQAIKQ